MTYASESGRGPGTAGPPAPPPEAVARAVAEAVVTRAVWPRPPPEATAGPKPAVCGRTSWASVSVTRRVPRRAMRRSRSRKCAWVTTTSVPLCSSM